MNLHYPRLIAALVALFLTLAPVSGFSEPSIGNEVILGSLKDKVVELFKDWERSINYETNVDPKGLKFTNRDLIVVVDFNDQGIAEGVSFLTNKVDDMTGKTAYVNLHQKELLDWAGATKETKIEYNKTSEFPIEMYIGSCHE